MTLHYEDFAVGEIAEYGAYLVTPAEIMAFAALYDAQPFHTSEAEAAKLMLAGLSASGWHTAAMLMRMNCDGFVNQSASWGGASIEEVRWLRPVRPGDTLRVRRVTKAARESVSRPEIGIIDFHFDVLNQRGETVMTQDNAMMIGRRGRTRQQRPAKPAPAMPDQAKPAAPMPPQPVWFGDLAPGMHTQIGAHQFTRGEIIAFATAYDPQPFHLSEAGAAASHFGRLAASGWQTAGIWMSLMIGARARQQAPLLANGIILPEPGVSPGFRNMRWLKPVFAGDTISFATAIVEKRASASRPGWGLVSCLNTGANQHGERVFEFVSSLFWQMRPDLI